MPATADEMPRLRHDLAAELAARKKAATQDQQAALTTLRTAIGQYLARWRDSAPDDTGDVERSGSDFAALHEEISRRRLPEAMTRFQRMITEDMVPSVSVLHRTIETEAADIRPRMGRSTPDCGARNSTRAPACRSPGAPAPSSPPGNSAGRRRPAPARRSGRRLP